MKLQFAAIFLLLTAAASIPVLLSTGRAFRSIEPVPILSAVWVVLLAAVVALAGRRIAQPVPASRQLRGSIIFLVHSLLIAGWFAWALYQESQHSVGGWATTLLLHYTIEAPSSGACWLVERLWRYAVGHGPRISWFYPVYLVIGGAFYACLPSLFHRTPEHNTPLIFRIAGCLCPILLLLGSLTKHTGFYVAAMFPAFFTVGFIGYSWCREASSDEKSPTVSPRFATIVLSVIGILLAVVFYRTINH